MALETPNEEATIINPHQLAIIANTYRDIRKVYFFYFLSFYF